MAIVFRDQSKPSKTIQFSVKIFNKNQIGAPRFNIQIESLFPFSEIGMIDNCHSIG